MEVKTYGKRQCVRVMVHPSRLSPVDAFLTIETFEVYDRIAQHIRRIANVRL